MNRLRLLWCVPLLFLLAACGGSEGVEPAAEVSELSPRSADVEQPTVVPTEVEAVAPESPTAVPTATAVPEAVPTATEAPIEAVENEAELEEPEVEEVVAEPEAVEVAFNGRTEEGALFRGAADAPVTLIDYSDFL